MSNQGFLYTAYVVVWVVHIAYAGYLASRYAKLRRELEDLKREEK
jgi:CcmD family protein